MATRSLQATRTALSSALGSGQTPAAARFGYPSLFRRGIICLVIVSTLGIALRFSSLSRSSAQATGPTLSSHALVLSSGALPGAIRLLGGARWGLGAEALDNNLQSAVALDRADGIRDGLVQELRDGPRQIRVLVRLYTTAGGAARAYARLARYLRIGLPDPSLRMRVDAASGLGAPAVLASYDSTSGRLHYTASALAFRSGALVCELQAFPLSIDNGMPARDPADLIAVGRVLAGRAASTQGS